MVLVLLIMLVALLLAAIPVWPHSRNWGYYPSGGIGAVLIIILLLLLIERWERDDELGADSYLWELEPGQGRAQEEMGQPAEHRARDSISSRG